MNAKSLLLEEKVARRSRDGCGVAATAFTPHQSASLTASPQTGDNSNLGLWVFLLVLSSCSMIALLVIDIKKKIAK